MPGQTAIVTGGAGFIGSHLADSLLADGQSVVVLDDLSSGRQELVPDGASLEVVDLADTQAVDRVFDASKPSAVFHLGAQSSVTVSVTDPARDLASNVLGTLNVLEACKRHDSPLVFTSTGGALYGNEAPLPTPEDRIPAPLAPYGASKWAGEAYIRTWTAAGGVPHAICRLGNVYGPRQSPHGEAGVVSIFAYLMSTNQSPKLFGHGKPTRDYVHVADVVSGLRAASGSGEVFNIATGRETDVQTIFELVREATGADVEPELAPLREGELERSCMDPGKAERLIGWKAQVEVETGIRETVPDLVANF